MARVTVARSPSVLMPNVGMSQSGLMVASLLGGFVVYLALNQKLGAYWSILIGGSSSTATAASTPSTTTAPATTTSPSTTATSAIPSSQASVLGLGGTGGAQVQSGTVGYNALSGAGSGLTAASAGLFSGSD